jgi:hypothetical protein
VRVATAAAVVLAVAHAARAQTPPRPAVTLDVTLDPDARRVAGHARLQITNTSAVPLVSVPLWLYPNHLATRPAALNDVAFHWLYPGVFSAGGMDLGAVRADGAPAAVALEDTRAGARTLARVTLPAPLAPGAAVTLDADFETRIPRRLGGFGCDGPRCRLMGGFYPTPAHLGAGGFDLAAAPDRTDARVTVRSPPDLALVVGGELGAAPASVDVESHDVPYATIVSDGPLHTATAEAGGLTIRYLHRRPRPPDSDAQPLPYVREDVPGLVLGAARRAVEFLREQGFPPPAAGAPPVTLVEAPLRHELVQAHGDVILVTDQIFGNFPLARLRKYHRFEIARAVFTALADQALAAGEAPADRDLAAGVLASYLTEVYALRELGKIEYARDLLQPFDFVPAVDQLIYAPLLASSASYFGDVEDTDRLRDDVRRFANDRPAARLVYSKLLDLLGPAGMTRLPRAMLGAHVPLRRAAAEVFGGDLDWFWRQWLGPTPRVNYRLGTVRVGPAPGHVTVEVVREGDAVREPVEIAVADRAGGTRTLVWSDGGPSHRFELDLPAGLRSVEIDPRGRLVETALGSLGASDDPRTDNRDPSRLRVLYEGLGWLLNVSQLKLTFATAVLIKPQHDLHHAVTVSVFHDEATTIGVGARYSWSFGPQVDKNTLANAISVGLVGSRLDPSFGLALGEAPQPGWRFTARAGAGGDTRDYLIDPWRAVGVDAGASVSVTALDDGRRLVQASAGIEGLRLFELLPGHVLAMDASAAATGGDIALRSQLVGAGGPGGLRGFFADELLGRANAIGRLELRDDYVTGLAWNLLHFTTVRGLAGTLFADVAAVSSCDGYAFSSHRLYADAGYSFRVLHEAFGVYQELFSIDFAVPFGRRSAADMGTCLGLPPVEVTRPPFVVLLSFLPSF